MLHGLPYLQSLPMSELPDRDEFVSAMPQLEQGLLAVASALQHLDVSLEKYNREAWCNDPFVKLSQFD